MSDPYASGLSVLNSAIGGLGKRWEAQAERERAAQIGALLQGGDPMAAAKQAFANGDTVTGLALLKWGTEQAKIKSGDALVDSLNPAGNPALAPLGGGGPVASAPAGTSRGTSYRGGPIPDDIKGGIVETAQALGISPVDLATVISYETGGSFNPTQAGPTTKWGQHRGFIQFGEPQARQHGVDWSNPTASQLGPNGAVAKYLLAAGVRPGMGLNDIYSAINAGGVGRYGAMDRGTSVQQKVNGMGAHRLRAQSLFGDLANQPVAGGAAAEGGPGGSGFFVPPGGRQPVEHGNPPVEMGPVDPEMGPTIDGVPFPPPRPPASELPITTPPAPERGMLGMARDLLFPKNGRYEPGGAGYQAPTPALDREQPPGPEDPRAAAYAAQRAAGRAPLPAELALRRSSISTPDPGATVARPPMQGPPIPPQTPPATPPATPPPAGDPAALRAQARAIQLTDWPQAQRLMAQADAIDGGVATMRPQVPGQPAAPPQAPAAPPQAPPGRPASFIGEGLTPSWGGSALAPLGAPQPQGGAYAGGATPRRAPVAAPAPIVRRPVAAPAPVPVAPRPPDLTTGDDAGSRQFAMSQGANAPGVMNFGRPREVLAGQQSQQRQQAAAARPTPAQPPPKIVKPPGGAAGYSSLPPGGGGGQPYSPPFVAPSAGGGLASGAVPPGGPTPSAAPASQPSGGPPVAPIVGDNPAALRAQAAQLAQANPEAARQLNARADLAERRPPAAPAPAAAPQQAALPPLGAGPAAAPAAPATPPVAAPAAPAAAPARTALPEGPIGFSETARGQQLQRAYDKAPTDDHRAKIAKRIEIEMKDYERKLEAQKTPAGIAAQFEYERSRGLTTAKNLVEYEASLAAGKREPFTEKPSDLRTQIANLPAFKNLSIAIVPYNAMVDAANRDTATSDMSMVFQFAKMLDPTSVVRGNEIAMVNSTQSTVDMVNGFYRGLDGKSRLSPVARQNMMDEARSLVQGYRGEYDNMVKMYTGIAERSKLNPADIIPPISPLKEFGKADQPPVTADVKDRERILQTIPAPALDFLRKNPGSRALFDKSYGAGSAALVLGGG